MCGGMTAAGGRAATGGSCDRGIGTHEGGDGDNGEY
jgi:hypothetical protein